MNPDTMILQQPVDIAYSVLIRDTCVCVCAMCMKEEEALFKV